AGRPAAPVPRGRHSGRADRRPDHRAGGHHHRGGVAALVNQPTVTGPVVVTGRGLLDELVTATTATGAARAALVHPPTLTLTAEAIRDALADSGLDVHLLEVPDAE